MPTEKVRATDDANGAPLRMRKRKDLEEMSQLPASCPLPLPDMSAATIAGGGNVQCTASPLLGESHVRSRRHPPNQSRSSQELLDEGGSSADKVEVALVTGSARLRLLSRKELLSQETLREMQYCLPGKRTRRSMSRQCAEVASRDKRKPHLEASLGLQQPGSDVKS